MTQRILALKLLHKEAPDSLAAANRARENKVFPVSQEEEHVRSDK